MKIEQRKNCERQRKRIMSSHSGHCSTILYIVMNLAYNWTPIYTSENKNKNLHNNNNNDSLKTKHSKTAIQTEYTTDTATITPMKKKKKIFRRDCSILTNYKSHARYISKHIQICGRLDFVFVLFIPELYWLQASTKSKTAAFAFIVQQEQ